MLPDRLSNPGPLTYESGALPIALRGPACSLKYFDTAPQILKSNTASPQLPKIFKHACILEMVFGL